MDNNSDEAEQESFIQMQTTLTAVRSCAPEKLQALYGTINEIKDKILKEKQCIVETEDFIVPEIKDPFESYNHEELRITNDKSLQNKLKEEIQMMLIYTRKKNTD